MHFQRCFLYFSQWGTCKKPKIKQLHYIQLHNPSCQAQNYLNNSRPWARTGDPLFTSQMRMSKCVLSYKLRSHCAPAPGDSLGLEGPLSPSASLTPLIFPLSLPQTVIYHCPYMINHMSRSIRSLLTRWQQLTTIYGQKPIDLWADIGLYITGLEERLPCIRGYITSLWQALAHIYG